MRQQGVKFGLILIFIIGLVALFVYSNIHRPRLLILHSYDTSYSWTRDLNVGLRRILDTYTNYSIRWHYMDTKRHPHADFKRVAGNGARRAIEQWEPQVVIAIDDDAQEYAAKYFVNHPRINILFAGVNGGTDAYGYPGARNVTGIFERKQLVALQEVAQLIGAERPHPGALRILHLADRSGSVKEDAAFMERHDWRPTQFMGSRLIPDFEQWKLAVNEASQQADLILLSNYRKLARSASDDTLVPSQEVMRWTVANSKLPLIGSNLFNVEDGANLAVGVSPFEQGEVVARMAVEVLEKGITPADIPTQSTQQFIISLRKRGLDNEQIHLPSIYEAFARATNNFFEVESVRSGVAPPRRDGGTGQHYHATFGEDVSSVPPPHQDSMEAVVTREAATKETAQAPLVPSAPPSNPAPLTGRGPATGELHIVAKQASWVEIWDGSGKRLSAGIRPPGSRLSIKGDTPFRLNLGNPKGLSVKFNGQPVERLETRGRPFNLP